MRQIAARSAVGNKRRLCLGLDLLVSYRTLAPSAPLLTQRHQRATAAAIQKETCIASTGLLPRVALATSPLLAGGLAATKTPARSQSSATQKTLRVAVVQMLVGSDKATNLKNAERLVNQACDGNADVVVVPRSGTRPTPSTSFGNMRSPLVKRAARPFHY